MSHTRSRWERNRFASFKMLANTDPSTPAPPSEADMASEGRERGGSLEASAAENFTNETLNRTEEKNAAYYITRPAVWPRTIWNKYGKVIKLAIKTILVLAYFAYLIAACVLKWDLAYILLILTIIVCVFVAWELFQKYQKGLAGNLASPFENLSKNYGKWIHTGFWVVCLALIIVWIILDCRKHPEKLVSLAGVVVFLAICMMCSATPDRIKWRPVTWGLLLAFAIQLFVFRTKPGNSFFRWLSDNISKFLNFTNYGADFVFGDLGKSTDAGNYSNLANFATRVLPIIIFFSGVVSVLYYWGLMVYIIRKISWLMVHTLGTTGPETMVAAGNIFVGQTEAPLLIRPFLNTMTNSELVAVMTTGMGSISGSVLGAYISFGIPATDLVTACVVSAPTSLAVSKIIYPEIEQSTQAGVDDCKGEKSEYGNFIEAFAGGAAMALPLALNVGANLIAFVSILQYINSLCMWLGEMVTITSPPLTLDRLLGWLFYPAVFLMGVDRSDLLTCGQLVGKRIFLNEFVAFQEMGTMHANRVAGLPKYDDTGNLQWLSPRSESILTYAIAGFANIGSVGIMLGGLTPMCPGRAKDVAKTVLVSLVAANMACFLRAALAGLVYN